MERKSLFTKERADFAFNKINHYYTHKAYKQALAEIEANKELTGSSLNIGKQLQLNKIYTDCIVHIMLDAFEVDGNIESFSAFMVKHHTNLELHASRDDFQLLSDYYHQKDQHPNFKSRTTYYNQDIEPDNSKYEDTVSEPIKKTSMTHQDHDEIKKNFLDSIEKPSYHYAPLDEDEGVDTHVIKSNVDRQAIHDDFFDAISSPTSSKDNRSAASDSDFTQKSPFSDEAEKRAQKLQSDLKDSKSSARKKLNSQDSEDDYIKEKKEIIQNGEKYTQTTHKSGGRVTEFTLGGPNDGSGEGSRPAAPPKKNEYQQEVEARQRKKAKQAQAAKVASEQKKANAEKKQGNGAKSGQKSSTASSANKSEPKSSSSQPGAKGVKFNFIPLLAIVLVVALGYGGFKFFGKDADGNNDNTPPITDNGDTADNGDSTPPDEASPDGDVETDPTTEPAVDEDSDTETSQDYILPSQERELVDSDFEGLTKSDLRYAINEMFARHGWNFGGAGDFYDYFSEKSWYQPDMSMTSDAQAEQKFSSIERANLRIIINKRNSM